MRRRGWLLFAAPAAAMKTVLTSRMVEDFAMVSNARRFAARLAAVDQATFQAFPGLTHASAIPAYLGAGVRLGVGVGVAGGGGPSRL